MVGWFVGLIKAHGSWLMTGKNLVSTAALIGKKIEEVGAAVAAAVVAAQVITLVPLKFGVSAFNQY